MEDDEIKGNIERGNGEATSNPTSARTAPAPAANGGSDAPAIRSAKAIGNTATPPAQPAPATPNPASSNVAAATPPAAAGNPATPPMATPNPATAAPNPATTTSNPAIASSATDQKRANTFKFIGLIAFFILLAIVIIMVWPYVSEVFEEGGIERLTTQVHDAGVGGVFILLGFQVLQVVVAFIPGEVVQMAAGIIYGPWLGALIILIGCIVSSAFIFWMVHWLGAPFVHSVVPEKFTAKFREFEKSRKFNSIIFILFLIPGMPKDVFTYLTPLTDMRMKTFLLLTNSARIPGIVVSTYAADGLVEGRIWQSIVIFLVLAIIAVLALVFYNRIIDLLDQKTGKNYEKLSALDDK